MSKLDKLDTELSAPEATLNKVAETVSAADINQLLASDIPFESKASQLSGLIALLEETNQAELMAQAKSALRQVENNMSDPLIPQITS